MTKDRLTRIISEKLMLRIYTATTLETVEKITTIHNTTPNATVALGRTITGTALLSAGLKPESNQSISVKFSGTGPAKELQVQADARGNIRGYISNPDVDTTDDLGGLSFSRTIGAGFISVTKDIGMTKPYNSILPLQYGDVAGDIAYYLTTSEQVPSALIIGLELKNDLSVISSGGILVQSLPETDPGVIERISGNITSMKEPLGKHLIRDGNILTCVTEILETDDYEIIGSSPVREACRCSREILYSVLKQLNHEDIKEMIEKDKGAEITCTFCKKQYHFDESDLKKIL